MAHQPVHQLFSDVAQNFSGNIAIDRVTRRITYGELEARSNRLANALLGNGEVGLTAIIADDPIEVVTTILGILKAGGVFVPMDPSFPLKRLQAMAAQVQPQAWICESAHASKVEQIGVLPESPVIRLDETDHMDSATPSLTPPPDEAASSIYFTSGSTGRPKAILGRLRGIDDFVRWEIETLGIGAGTRVSQLASPSFDGFLKDVFVPLCAGGTVCAPESRGVVLEAGRLADWVDVEGIEVLQCVPSVFRSLLNQKLDANYFSALKWVVLAGEALLPADVRRWMEVFGDRVKLLNLYGPTETTITKLYYVVQPEDIARPSIPIGKPMRGSAVMVLNAARKPCPTGVAGEIYIRTPYRALGYYKDPELTGQVFLKNPFRDDPQDIVYRTGDYGRLLKDGNLEFLGRKDDQVKIRGVRVELGEIENVLRGHGGVRDVAVVDREDGGGNKFLCAYVVLSGEVQGGELREYSAERLPEAMVPSAFVEMQELPRTLNGKIDRKALPALEQARRRRESRPATPVEEIIAGVWGEVLQLQQVGGEENFFELGGHSLLATQVVSRVRASLGVQVPLRALFEAPTVAGMARYVEQNIDTAREQPLAPIRKRDRSENLPLSYAQQRLWFIQQFEPGSAAYNMPFGGKLLGPVDHFAMQQSFAEIVWRHEILRTTFPMIDGVAVQLISSWSPEVNKIDLRHLPAEQREIEARRLANEEVETPFDLQAGPLLRVRLIQLGELEHVLLATMHHIVSDAWSMEVLAREFCVLYEAFHKGLASPLAELPIQYADYAAWQREWLREEVLEREMEYWRTQLAGYSGVVELPADRPRLLKRGNRGGMVVSGVNAEEAERLRRFSRREGVTLFMTLAAALNALLYRYTGQKDLAVGTPIANRNRVEAEGLIGVFVNTLVLRAHVEPAESFRDLLQRVRETALEAYMHQDVPFEKLVEEVRPERDLSRTPLFQVFMVVQNTPAGTVSLPDLELQRLPMDVADAKFELIVGIGETAEGRRTNWHYNADLFDEATIMRLAEHFERLVQAVVEDAERKIGDLPLLSADECRQIVEEQNATGRDYRQIFLHEMFEEAAERSPSAPALAWKENRWSYRDLNNRANHIAGMLRKNYGVTAETRVSICLERGPEIVAAMLGVLKAGGAYVPLDPGYPCERLGYMLNDSGAAVLLAESATAQRVPASGTPVVLLEELETGGVNAEKPHITTQGEQAAYVIYTSGSTGKPKGVLVTQRGLSNYVGWAREAYQFRAEGCTPLYSSLGFDLTVTSLWPTLVSGGCVVVVPEKEGIEWLAMRHGARGEGAAGAGRDEKGNGSGGKQARYEVLKATPSHLRVLKEALGQGGGEIADRLVIGGEALRWEDLSYWSSQAAGTRVVNEYGPTETVVGSCVYEVGNEREAEGAVPIGRPIANTRVYVVDEWGNLAPGGAMGELYIGGEGVARGYLGQPGLTAERFVPDGLSGRKGERLYRTGDKVRWRSDGELEYLGRLDNQVKIRGYRIELGEIEAVLAGHERIREAAVVVREDTPNDPRLVAYIVENQSLIDQELREFLEPRLPNHMIPSIFVRLAALPLTSNGKVNQRALPSPAVPRLSQEEGALASHSFTEEAIARIWEEVLQLPHVSLDDNFFELGGHSLLGTRVMSRIRVLLGLDLPLRVLFESATVSGLARGVEKEIEAGAQRKAAPMLPAARTPDLPLSYAQQRLWFLEQLQPGSAAYNNGFGLRLKGSLSRQAVQYSLEQIVQRHEILRTSFPMRGGIAVQRIADSWRPELMETDLRFLPYEQREKSATRLAKEEASIPFNLEEGPLLRLRLLQLDDHDYLLCVVMHHLVGDGWSLAIMVREFSSLYLAHISGRDPELPMLDIQYADFSVWQREWLQGQVLENQVAYWKKQLSGIDRLSLPTDFPRNSAPTKRAEQEPFELSRPVTDGLNDLSKSEGVTLFMVLLTAYQLVLARYTGGDDVVIGTDIANRNRIETERLIGFFVNQLAIRTNLTGASSFREMLQRVRHNILDAYVNQDLPFERVVDELQVERRPGQHPIFQVKFTLQNMPRQNLQLPDLDISFLSLADAPPKMDMVLIVSEAADGLAGLKTYNSELYSATTIRGLMQLYRALLSVLAADPNILNAPRSKLMAAAEMKARDLLQPYTAPLQTSGVRNRRGNQVVDA